MVHYRSQRPTLEAEWRRDSASKPQLTLWESILPESCLDLPGDLADELLDDERFLEPFRPFFDPVMARPSIPIEAYLRMMFLKYRYRLRYEPLCREVADSIAWRRFCRVPIDQEVPHPTTLMKITSCCGERAVAGLNDALLAKAAQNKVIKTDKVRADTTVVEADVVYPTDSGLLAKGVAKLARLAAQLKAAGLATRTTARDRTRSVRRRAHAIGAWLRRRSDDAKEEAKAITGKAATIATCAIADARHVATNARRGLRRKPAVTADRGYGDTPRRSSNGPRGGGSGTERAGRGQATAAPFKPQAGEPRLKRPSSSRRSS